MASVIRGSDNMDSAQVRPVLMAAQTASGTAVDFTGIPSWAQKVTVMFNGVSTNGTSGIVLQLGAGSLVVSGYSGAMLPVQATAVSGTAVVNSTSMVLVQPMLSATDLHFGSLTLLRSGANSWGETGSIANSTGSRNFVSSGQVTLPGTLDRIRVTTVNGTDTFDAGTISVLYE